MSWGMFLEEVNTDEGAPFTNGHSTAGQEADDAMDESGFIAGATWSKQYGLLHATGRFIWRPINKACTAWIAMPAEN